MGNAISFSWFFGGNNIIIIITNISISMGSCSLPWMIVRSNVSNKRMNLHCTSIFFSFQFLSRFFLLLIWGFKMVVPTANIPTHEGSGYGIVIQFRTLESYSPCCVTPRNHLPSWKPWKTPDLQDDGGQRFLSWEPTCSPPTRCGGVFATQQSKSVRCEAEILNITNL